MSTLEWILIFLVFAFYYTLAGYLYYLYKRKNGQEKWHVYVFASGMRARVVFLGGFAIITVKLLYPLLCK